MFLLEGYVGARLDRSVSFVSELGARGEPGALFFRSSDFVAGSLLFVGAVLAWSILPRNWFLRAGVACSIVFAALTAFDAFLPMDCAPTVDEACRAAEEAGTLQWQHLTHNWTGVVEGVVAPAAMFLIAIGVWQLRRGEDLPRQWEPVWQELVIFGLLYTVLSAVIAVAYLFDVGELGIAQRLQIVVYGAGMFTLGLVVRNYRGPRPAVPPQD